jgi:hypothetical protein
MELELASTRRMLAPGATAWAHSTSREISTAQESPLPEGSVVGRLEAAVEPFWLTTVSEAVGRLKVVSKVVRSAAMSGSL